MIIISESGTEEEQIMCFIPLNYFFFYSPLIRWQIGGDKTTIRHGILLAVIKLLTMNVIPLQCESGTYLRGAEEAFSASLSFFMFVSSFLFIPRLDCIILCLPRDSPSSTSSPLKVVRLRCKKLFVPNFGY